MSHYIFKEVDLEGRETLEAMASAPNFSAWQYDTVKEYCKGRMLEVGSGIGNISALLLEDTEEVVLSDVRQTYCDYLQERFSLKKACRGITRLDLVHPAFDEVYASLLGSFDTVIALNVIEHISNHHLAIGNAFRLLKRGGRLVVLVPAYPFLYNRFDHELGHYRRYTRQLLTSVMAVHVASVHTRYFNVCGIPGWFFSGRIMNRKIIPAGQLKLFDKLVPFFRRVDRLIGCRAGLSVMAVGEKQ